MDEAKCQLIDWKTADIAVHMVAGRNWAYDCNQKQGPALLLGNGIGVFVEMWEISFFKEERNPAYRDIRWKNRRYVI